jgi:signal transduction histidine kinase
MTIRLQLVLGFFILIGVFAMVFFVNQRLSQQVITNTYYLNNSEAVIRNSSMLHKEMIQMQSGFRGFLLTNQESFLQYYYDGLRNVPPLIEDQHRLLSTTHQQQKLDTIVALHKEWIVYADSLISTKKDSAANITYRRLFDKKLKMEVGKKLNDRITDLFIELDNNEYTLRQARRSALQQSVVDTRRLSIALIVGAILLAIASSFYFIRAVSARISKMVGLAERISHGEFISIEDRKRDEFSKLTASLNKMSATLEKNFNELTKKNKELDQFAYVVSHDLKAPLRGISNIISWIEEDHGEQVSPEIRRDLDLIKGRTTRLENMINGLLEYARVGKTKRNVESVSVHAVLMELKDVIIPPRTSLVIPAKLPEVVAVRVQIEQVFANLLSNAVKYNSSNHPQINVTYRDAGEFHVFSVADNGPGIEEKYFEKIFEIFQTLQERDAFESTGVGLAIVKKIIEDNGGTIRVESAPGKGAVFIFTWPKAKEESK